MFPRGAGAAPSPTGKNVPGLCLYRVSVFTVTYSKPNELGPRRICSRAGWKVMNKINRETAIASGIFILSMIVLFVIIPTQVENVEGYGIGPRFFPYAMVTTIAVLSLVMLVTSMVVREKNEKTPWAGKKYVILLAVISLLYILGMKYLGYFFPTIVFFAVVMIVFGERRVGVVTAISVIGTLMIFLIFGNLLKLLLPKGLLSPLFEFLLFW